MKSLTEKAREWWSKRPLNTESVKPETLAAFAREIITAENDDAIIAEEQFNRANEWRDQAEKQRLRAEAAEQKLDPHRQTLADKQLKDMETMSCGHMKKYQVGWNKCLICRFLMLSTAAITACDAFDVQPNHGSPEAKRIMDDLRNAAL